MSWTRLDDAWTEMTELAELEHGVRWHYLAMIQFCSRTDKVDGVMRVLDAYRCSDYLDPEGAIKALEKAGLVKSIPSSNPMKATVKVIRIDDHIPPPSVRNKREADKLRKRRQRAHDAGDHSLCIADKCPHVTPNVTRDVTRDPGTGQDRTGRDNEDAVSDEKVDLKTGEVRFQSSRPLSPAEQKAEVAARAYAAKAVTSWDVAQIPQDEPDYCEHGVTFGAKCRQCPNGIAEEMNR